MGLRWDKHVNRPIGTKITYVFLAGNPLESDQILDQKDQKILSQMLKAVCFILLSNRLWNSNNIKFTMLVLKNKDDTFEIKPACKC
jgi:hypothetical protein